MSDNDTHLLSQARELLEQKYNPPVHSVASALRTSSGKVITAVNVDHFTSFVCAETAALSSAINQGIYDIESVVAVRKNSQGQVDIANMCGKCRQIYYDYAPNTTVIVTDGDVAMTKTIDQLLPFAFTRQREKIQTVINNGAPS